MVEAVDSTNEIGPQKAPIHHHTLVIDPEVSKSEEMRQALQTTVTAYDVLHGLVRSLEMPPEHATMEDPSLRRLMGASLLLVQMINASARIREIDDYTRMAPTKLTAFQLESMSDTADECFPLPEKSGHEWLATWSKGKKKIRLVHVDENEQMAGPMISLADLEGVKYRQFAELVDAAEKMHEVKTDGEVNLSIGSLEDLMRYKEVVSLAFHDISNPLNIVTEYSMMLSEMPPDDSGQFRSIVDTVRKYLEILKDTTETGQELLELEFKSLTVNEIRETLTKELKPLQDMDIEGQQAQVDIIDNTQVSLSAFFSSGLVSAFAKGSGDDGKKAILKRNKLVRENKLPAERLQEVPHFIYTLDEITTETGSYLKITVKDNGGGISNKVLDADGHFIKHRTDWEGAASGHGIGHSTIDTIARTAGGQITARNWEGGAEVSLWMRILSPPQTQ